MSTPTRPIPAHLMRFPDRPVTDHIIAQNSPGYSGSATQKTWERTFAVALALGVRIFWFRALPAYRERAPRDAVAAECRRLRRLRLPWPKSPAGGVAVKCDIAAELLRKGHP